MSDFSEASAAFVSVLLLSAAVVSAVLPPPPQAVKLAHIAAASTMLNVLFFHPPFYVKYVIRRTIPLVKRFSIRLKKINSFFIFALQLFYNYSRCFVNKFRKKTNILKSQAINAKLYLRNIISSFCTTLFAFCW